MPKRPGEQALQAIELVPPAASPWVPGRHGTHERRLKPPLSGLYLPEVQFWHSVAPPVAYLPGLQRVQSLALSGLVVSFALNLPLGHWTQRPVVMMVGKPLHPLQPAGASACLSDPLGQRYRLPHAAELVPKGHGCDASRLLPGPESPQHVREGSPHVLVQLWFVYAPVMPES